VLAGHLLAPSGSASLLRRLLVVGQCMTSVLHAAELLACARTDGERGVVEGLLKGLKVVGLNGRYAVTMARLRATTMPGGRSSTGAKFDTEAVALAALAIESKLVIVTERLVLPLSDIAGLRVLSASALERESDEGLRRAVLDGTR